MSYSSYTKRSNKNMLIPSGVVAGLISLCAVIVTRKVCIYMLN